MGDIYRNIRKSSAMLPILLAGLIIGLSAVPSAQAADLCSYDGPYISENYLEVSDFRVTKTGPKPLVVNDTVTVSFTLKSVEHSVQFGGAGVYVNVRDPAGKNRSFGNAYHLNTLQKGESINFTADITVNKSGNWTFWPVYSSVQGNPIYAGYRLKSTYKNREIGDYFSVRSSGTKCMAINGKPNVISPILLEMGENENKTLASGGTGHLEMGIPRLWIRSILIKTMSGFCSKRMV